MNFAAIRDTLKVSDSVVSKHLSVLQKAGYVKVLKSTVNSKTQTRVAITPTGKRAYRSHVAELQRLVSFDQDFRIPYSEENSEP